MPKCSGLVPHIYGRRVTKRPTQTYNRLIISAC